MLTKSLNKVQPVIDIAHLARQYKYFLFDCDGVLWHGNNHVGQAFRNIEKLEQAGAKMFFVTNWAATSRRAMSNKMASDTFGYKSV